MVLPLLSIINRVEGAQNLLRILLQEWTYPGSDTNNWNKKWKRQPIRKAVSEKKWNVTHVRTAWIVIFGSNGYLGLIHPLKLQHLQRQRNMEHLNWSTFAIPYFISSLVLLSSRSFLLEITLKQAASLTPHPGMAWQMTSHLFPKLTKENTKINK